MKFGACLLILATIAIAGPGAAQPTARAPAATIAARTRPVVVIDAGHGGSNAGARGAVPGVHEKQVTLAMATRVAAVLERRGVEVHLTRTGDATMTLRQRVAIANERAADLFISIHANASATRSQRGYETFVLTPAGVDVDARALRSETGTPRAGVPDDVALILDDVERGAVQWEAADLAAAVQGELREARGKDGDRGVRQDAHHVLIGATMPAVLVEIGFVDHPIEGRELVDPAVQARLALAIADGISAQLPASRPR